MAKKSLVKWSTIIALVLSLLVFSGFMLKKLADKVFLDKLIIPMEAEDTGIDALIEYIKTMDASPMPYDAQHFESQLRMLQASNRGYFSKEDVMQLDVELPAIQVFFFDMGIDNVYMNTKQSELLNLRAIHSLKSISQEDFGNDVEKWRQWQQQKHP